MKTCTVTLTPDQLSLAQMGEEVTLHTGHTLCALPVEDGWKYLLSWKGVVGVIRYAPQGMESAEWALNASEKEYAEQ